MAIFFSVILSAQKFHFQNYNVQQGLIQSQVIAITQDHFDNLWFCTLGGISRFDGKVFTNYSETDGLISNFVNTIMADHESNIWIGTLLAYPGLMVQDLKVQVFRKPRREYC